MAQSAKSLQEATDLEVAQNIDDFCTYVLQKKSSSSAFAQLELKFGNSNINRHRLRKWILGKYSEKDFLNSQENKADTLNRRISLRREFLTAYANKGYPVLAKTLDLCQVTETDEDVSDTVLMDTSAIELLKPTEAELQSRTDCLLQFEAPTQTEDRSNSPAGANEQHM